MPALSNYFYRVYQSGSQWIRLQWNTNARQANSTTVASSIATSYPANTIVDVYQKAAGQVVMVSYMGPSVVGNLGLNLSETTISGSTGDIYNTLIFQRYNSSASPPTYEFGVYSHTTKDVTVFTYPIASYPWGYDDSLPLDTIIQQYCSGTTLKRVYYDGADGVTVDDTVNSATCGYVAPVPDVLVTEVKRIKIDHTCYNEPVFLVWKNTLGGWDQWLFYNTQTENLKTESIGEFTEPVYDLANSEGFSKSLGYNTSESIIAGADNLTDNQYEAIKEMLFSPMIYKVETDSTKKIYKVKPGSFSKETKNKVHSIEFELILPDKFTVRS